MKKISLTQGKFSLVDDEDFKRLNIFKWCAHQVCRGYFYAVRNIRENGKQITHRLAWDVIGKKPGRGYVVDHINGDTLDNRFDNLRIIHNSNNSRNLKLHRAGRRGIAYIKQGDGWIARICVNRKKKYLGFFKEKSEASLAYENALKSFCKVSF